MGTGMRRNSSIFQSTLPQGERRSDWSYAEVCWRFQSTLPQGERPAAVIALSRESLFQSTLPQGERRDYELVSYWQSIISIHAPARGATIPLYRTPACQLFQSTLPQGERRLICSHTITCNLFQSTLPQGERRYHLTY